MHLYDKTGKPVYQVPYANKKKGMRDATLRDAKKLGLFPSTTEILNILDKPGLNIWLQDRVLESALTLPRKKEESDKEYMVRIKQDSKELSLLARDEGTRIHDALESSFKDQVIDTKYIDLTNKVKQAVFEFFGTSEGWKAEESFAHCSGYGGKVDLNNRDIKVVIDFKTKEVFKTKMAFDEQIMQLVSYSQGLRIENARHVNVFVDYSGEIVFHEWKDDKGEVTRAYKMFMTCLTLWKLQKRYDPITS
jgi:hypothetical protein